MDRSGQVGYRESWVADQGVMRSPWSAAASLKGATVMDGERWTSVEVEVPVRRWTARRTVLQHTERVGDRCSDCPDNSGLCERLRAAFRYLLDEDPELAAARRVRPRGSASGGYQPS